MPPTNAISAAGVGPDSCVIIQADSDSAFLGGSFSGGNSFLPVVSPKQDSGLGGRGRPCSNTLPKHSQGISLNMMKTPANMRARCPELCWQEFSTQGGCHCLSASVNSWQVAAQRFPTNNSRLTGEVKGSDNFFPLRLCVEIRYSLLGFFDEHTDIM